MIVTDKYNSQSSTLKANNTLTGDPAHIYIFADKTYCRPQLIKKAIEYIECDFHGCVWFTVKDNKLAIKPKQDYIDILISLYPSLNWDMKDKIFADLLTRVNSLGDGDSEVNSTIYTDDKLRRFYDISDIEFDFFCEYFADSQFDNISAISQG